MATPIHVQFLSHDPATRIASRFEAAFESVMRRDGMEVYPALQDAWDQASEYHRTIELRPFEIPQGSRVRDTICRLYSLLPNAHHASRHAARMAATFFYPASGRTSSGTRAFSHLAMLCHAAAREPGRCELRFAEVNPRTHAKEVRRGQESFHHAEISRLLTFLSSWPPRSNNQVAA